MSPNRKRDQMRYQRVYRELRGRILSGHYAPGSQIETEPVLTEQFGVSIITIRQAAGMLEEEGLLDRRQGKGTFVPESVRERLKVLCVIGLNLAHGLQQRMGSYHSDLVLLAEEETARRGMEFEAVWLDARNPDRIKPYTEEFALREFWGFVFIACGANHALLRRVRALKMRHAVISAHAVDEHCRVRLDYREAVRLGLGVFDDGKAPPLIMGLDNLRKDVEAVLDDTDLRPPQEYLPWSPEGPGYDTRGYQRALELIEEGRDLSRLLLLDDTVAQGVTRALLRAGYGARDVKLAVLCGLQQIIPLGLPVTYVVHDAEEVARYAFDILEKSHDKGPGPEGRRCGFHLLEKPG